MEDIDEGEFFYNIRNLCLICASLQIAGLICIVLKIWSVVIVGGFAAVVRVFIPKRINEGIFNHIAAVAGFITMIWAMFH